jgi:hypothetical protein
MEGKPRRKIINIQVVACNDLKAKFGEVTKMAPFFYYQFYTFDEVYSATRDGPHPEFNEVKEFVLTFDGKV